MKISKTLLLGAASLAGVFASSGAAFAAGDWALGGTVAATNDYRFRGISQNSRNFAPQGSLNLTGPDGFYFGTWASEVDFDPTSSNNPYVEVDIYGGKHTDLWGVDWNFEPYYYSYPGADVPAGAPAPDYFELINQLSHSFGPLAATATWAYSPNLAFNGGTGNYLAGNLTYTVLDWLSVSGNLGHQWAQGAKYAGSRDYTHWDMGATASWNGFSFDARYVDTDLGNGQCAAFYMATRDACRAGFVATLTYTFTLFAAEAAAPPAPPPPPPPPPPSPPPPPPPPPPPAKTYIVFFDFDKSNLTAEAQSTVTEAVAAAKTLGSVRIVITGHTDTVGSDKYNQALSVRRAATVKDEMVRQGLGADAIAIEGKSFHDPLVPTGPGVREPKNRRAVIDLGG